MKSFPRLLVSAALGCALTLSASAAPDSGAEFKAQVAKEIDGMKKQIQVMNDTVFSFAELGYQEYETSKYLTGILEKEGFIVERGIAGLPTAWVASWGFGKPVISLGSDIDCIPQASQKPGVAYHDPIIEGAPGHGEGHNSGQPLNIVAALAVKHVMERAKLPGTIRLWPGIAEELLGGKAFMVRAGYFKDVDVALFAHVDSNMAVAWGIDTGTGLVSVEYTFKGESAHAAAHPWLGRSALDAVELMDVGWNFRREHLRLSQRSHYIITNGGDQPNVVPANASVWYYFRELDYEHIKGLREIGDQMAQGAAMMTNTTVSSRVLGSAWPAHFNKPVATVMDENIRAVGLPEWSDADQKLAKALQAELKAPIIGLPIALKAFKGPLPEELRNTGGSDDIGDVSWNVPTVTLRYPSNIPGLPGHNWANAISMATPIAHKGIAVGAKVVAMTMIDLLTKPAIIADAWKYFREEQTFGKKYEPLIAATDQPVLTLNKKTMGDYREQMKKFYYDPAKYDTYLEQLGITYPTVRVNAAAEPK